MDMKLVTLKQLFPDQTELMQVISDQVLVAMADCGTINRDSHTK
jgi:hypothetical protein